ncbi:MAG TPA: STAS domain-containing protein [Gemmataceae bacterium]|nr:STAS domain-containing protein [Gemmataceae bacterium]
MHEPPTQHVESRIEQGVLVVTINEPQLHSDVLVDAVGHELVLAVVHAKIRQVALDLHNVNVLTSIGIRPLLGLHRYLNQVGGRLVLCGLTKPVVDILRTSRLVGPAGDSIAIFETQPDAAVAVASLAKSDPEAPR